MAIFLWEIHNSPFFSGRARWSHSNLPGFGSLAFVVSLLPVARRKNGVGDEKNGISWWFHGIWMDMNGYQWILYTWINSRCFIIQLKRNVASSRLIRVIILQTVKNRSRGNSWFQDIHSSTQTAPISDGFGNVWHLFLMVLAMFCTYFWWFWQCFAPISDGFAPISDGFAPIPNHHLFLYKGFIQSTP